VMLEQSADEPERILVVVNHQDLLWHSSPQNTLTQYETC
jgi:hypothetical protein